MVLGKKKYNRFMNNLLAKLGKQFLYGPSRGRGSRLLRAVHPLKILDKINGVNSEPIVLYQFFNRYSYMIDNIVLLITGTLHARPIGELIPKCHPLGSFEQMEAIHIASTPAELYNAVLVDTPLGGVSMK